MRIDHGWITLQGEVEWEFQRRSAEKAIGSLIGVLGVSNEIRLRAKPQPAELARKIEEALARQALRESKQIQISVDGATVKLTGRVHPWHERETAAAVAWATPGARAVINELAIG